MRTTTTAIARGSTVHSTIRYIRETYGPAVLGAVLGRLDAEMRARLLDAAMTDDVPYEDVLMLWEAADVELRSRDDGWMVASGAFSIGSVGQQLYGGLLHRSDPAEFVTQSVSLFRLYYAPGNMVPVEVEPGRAVLRLDGFPTMSRLFCERQTGGLRCASELASGRAVQVSHVRCEHEGDAYCEWVIRWSAGVKAEKIGLV